jgi:hypothetical protein
VTICISEVNTAAAVPIIELAVVEASGSASVCKPCLLDPFENSVELGITNVESIVVAVEWELPRPMLK